MNQKELSVWLRVVVVLIGLAVLFLGVVCLPALGRDTVDMNPELSHLFWPCLLFLWATVLPVLAALVLAWLIFAEIGRDNSFCMANARRLRAISVLALVDSLLYVVWIVALGMLRVLHPSVLIGSVCIVFMGVGFTVGAAALSHLAQKAAALKDENDLVI